MQLRHLTVAHFRGIAALDWTVHSPFVCLIGPGDAGKSSVLDAIESVLSARWISFTENDFFGGDTTTSISIVVTIGELSKALKSDERFGLYVRGWTKAGALRDEPEGDDEPVLTVRLEVDATLEPVWQLVCERSPQPRILSNRDRLLFGLVRLSGDDARHLGWGQGSVLSRLTDDKDAAAAPLAEAYQQARKAADFSGVKSLCDAADQAQASAQTLGAYVRDAYRPGLELGRAGLSVGAIALHDGQVPLRLAGLGTRRLAVLAIQKSLIQDGAIVLIDEIEHGLEPHRIVGAVRVLKTDQAQAVTDSKAVGQVIMTTHSDVALEAAGSSSIAAVQTERANRSVAIKIAFAPSLDILLRSASRALLARRILLCEGITELGLLSALAQDWPTRHDGLAIEVSGATVADGHGGQGSVIAAALASLGYAVAWYRDSDVALTAEQRTWLVNDGTHLIEYGTAAKFEQALFDAASDEQIEQLIQYAKTVRDPNMVEHCLSSQFAPLGPHDFRLGFPVWSKQVAQPHTIRRALASTATIRGKTWFKDEQTARGLAPLVTAIVTEHPGSDLAVALASVEAWLYDPGR